jgi:hypothetical protein
VSEGAIELHAPVLPGNRGRRLMCFGSFRHEVQQGLCLDYHLRDVCYVEPCELESSHGNPSRGKAVPDNFREAM